MVLISTNKYQEAKAKLKLVMRKLGSANGAERTDDELLTQVDILLADIDALLHPANDDR